MYSGLLIFIGGVLVKTALTIAHGLKKKDWIGIAIALFISIYAFIRSLEDWSIQVGALVSIVTFIAIIAFTFKDRILPKITEGTLLLYGLVSLYLFEIHFKSDVLTYVIAEWVLIIYCLTIFLLCVTRIRIKPLIQIFLFICFLLLNLAIMSAFIQYGNFNLFCSTCSTNNLTNLSVFFTGYAFFNLASNLLFVLYFIPIPLSKHESFSQRISNIKTHARDLEKKYIDIDIGFNRTIIIVAIGTLLFLNHLYYFVDDATVISLTLILGGVLTSSSDTEETNTLS